MGEYMYYEVVVGVSLAITMVLLAPLMDGVRRKIRAGIQRRIGPPILQTYYDLSKLYRLKPVLPYRNILLVSTPYVVFILTITLALFTPFPAPGSMAEHIDILSYFYTLLTISTLSVLAALSIPNPYANAGGVRELLMIVFFEFFIALTLSSIAIKTGSLNLGSLIAVLGLPSIYFKISTFLAMLSLFYIGYVEGKFIPYDIAEAETEVLGGALLEYSGRYYALLLYSLLVKRLLLVSLPVMLFIVSPLSTMLSSCVDGSLLPLIDYLIYIVLIFIVYSLYSIFDSLNPRLRIDQVPRHFLLASLIPLISLVLGWIGW